MHFFFVLRVFFNQFGQDSELVRINGWPTCLYSIPTQACVVAQLKKLGCGLVDLGCGLTSSGLWSIRSGSWPNP